MYNKFHADFKVIILSIKIPKITFLTVILLCKYKGNCQKFQMMSIFKDKNISLEFHQQGCHLANLQGQHSQRKESKWE